MFIMFSEPMLLHWMPTSPRLMTCFVVKTESLERETIECQLGGGGIARLSNNKQFLTFC